LIDRLYGLRWTRISDNGPAEARWLASHSGHPYHNDLLDSPVVPHDLRFALTLTLPELTLAAPRLARHQGKCSTRRASHGWRRQIGTILPSSRPRPHG